MGVIGRPQPLLCVQAVHAHKLLRLSVVIHAVVAFERENIVGDIGAQGGIN